jgi:hypothetical protein
MGADSKADDDGQDLDVMLEGGIEYDLRDLDIEDIVESTAAVTDCIDNHAAKEEPEQGEEGPA